MAALPAKTAVVPSWLLPGLSPELDSAPGFPTLAGTQLQSCPEPWESNAQDPAKALPGHLGEPWMAEQGRVRVSRWLPPTVQFLEAVRPSDTLGFAGTKRLKINDNEVQ